MISGWVKRDDYSTNISSPGFERDQKYRGYLETRKLGSSDLRGLKKNSMRLLRHSASQLLRQDRTTDTGSVLWRCADLPGSGSSTHPVQKVWESETGEAPMAGKQSLLYETVFLLRWEKVSCHDRQGCGKRTETGLACGKGIGQGVHAGTASEKSSGCAPCIGIDEISLRKGHIYRIVVSDLERGKTALRRAWICSTSCLDQRRQRRQRRYNYSERLK